MFSGSTNPVNCGNHRAPTCEECSRGHGATWCAGDCKWDSNRNTCTGKDHDDIIFKPLFSYLLIYSFFNEDMHLIHISCITSGGVDPAPCSNKQSDYNCDWWKGKGFCTNSHDAYMKKYCKKACNQCQ